MSENLTPDDFVQTDEFKEELERIESEMPEFDRDEFVEQVQNESRQTVEQYLQHIAEGGCDDDDKACHNLASQLGIIDHDHDEDPEETEGEEAEGEESDEESEETETPNEGDTDPEPSDDGTPGWWGE